MPQSQQLRDEERFYIWQARRAGHTQQYIADALGRHSSMISRELRRNTSAQCHMSTYHWARHIVKHRKARAHRHTYRKLTDALTPISSSSFVNT